MKRIIDLLILLPAIAVISFWLLAIFPSLVNITIGNNFQLFWVGDLAFSLGGILFLFSIANLFWRRFNWFHQRHKASIFLSETVVVSTVLSLLLMWLWGQFPSLIFFSGDWYIPILLILQIAIFSAFFWGRKHTRIILPVLGIIVMIPVLFFAYQIWLESQPRYYFTFPLDDKRAVYLLNYDGDYWLTYYKNKEVCEEGKCTIKMEKVGNTSITQSPVELDSYLDKPVEIKGEFIKTGGSTNPGKEFCIKTLGQRKCRPSTGPGYWYASPLIIKEIKLLP